MHCAAQDFRVTEIAIDPQGRFTVEHEADARFYFILFRGTEVSDIRRAIDLALPVGAFGALTDLSPPGSGAFYQVMRVPLTAPFDSDSDGIDDVFELGRPFLNSLNPSDSLADFDGDGRSNLDEYRNGTDPALADAPALTVISRTSPADGESGVAVTRETILHFSDPLSSTAILGPNQFFAEFGGRRLLSRVELSSDRRKATLFYLEPLPGSARVRVTVDGAGVTDFRDRPVDFDGDGQPGGRTVIDFETLSVTAMPGTAVCGRVFASQLVRAGNGVQSVNVPLQGVTITVDGREETMRAVTDQNGDFRLEPAPAGRFFVHIDGRTATNATPTTKFPEGPYYPFVNKAWESVAREEVNIGEIYLPLVTGGTLQPANAARTTLVTFPAEILQQFPELSGLTLTVPPSALFSDDGARGGMIGIAPVPPDRLPGPLPAGVNPATVITVQTDGPTNFDVPIPVCFPNLPDPDTGMVLPAGAKSALFSFNHDTGEFEFAGSMTVSADGTQVCTDPGVGIPAPGWHFVVTVSVVGIKVKIQVDCETFRKIQKFLRDRRAAMTNPPPAAMAEAPRAAFAKQTVPREAPENVPPEILDMVDKGEAVLVVTNTVCPLPMPTMPRPTSDQPPADEECDADGACTTESETPSGPPGAGTPAGKRVYLHSGEEVLDRLDLFIPGRGDIHFAMRRTYRSQLAYNGPLGHGWNYHFNETLFFGENGDVTRALGNSHVDLWKRKPDGSYQAPAGFYGTLMRRSDGTFVYRTPDGFQRFYRADGRLFCHQDRHGNQMLFDYDDFGNLDLVIDVFGREIDFVFEPFPDGIDRLTRVIDFTGREIVYSYDANFDLVAARTPVVTDTSTGNNFPNGRTERYAYASGFAQPELNHNLLSVTYPEEVATGGAAALVWTYGTNPNNPVTFDRVLTETEGGTNASGIAAGGTMSFAYEMLDTTTPLGNPEVLRGKVTITERNGNRFEFFANELNHHVLTRRPTRGLRPGEPAFYETRSFYDEEGQLVRRVFPEGNEVRYRYDRAGSRAAHRNLMEIRRVADTDRGGGEDLVTMFTYEPLHNRIASVSDPRANAPGFVPPLGTTSAARYTTRFSFDYQESNDPLEHAVEFGIDLSGIARGLGDLNGDGRTKQAAGNLIRAEAPTVTLLPGSKEADRLGRTAQPIITQTQWNDRGQRIASIDAEGNVNEFSYYPENDPDGDGRAHVSPYLTISAEPTGYLRSSVIDSKTSPRRTTTVPPVALETVFRYDGVGNVIAMRNPRGIETTIEYNQLDEPVVLTRGADVAAALTSGQLLQNETPLSYRTRRFYDFNGRVVRREVENRDSTTAGVGPFVDRTYAYDILGNLLQSTVEIDATTTLTTRYRYDPNELPTLLTQPEGNQTRTEYDERNLPFRITRGFGGPDASTVQINYDLNANRREIIDAEDNDGNGQPERTKFAYDGFDRRIETVDALGNRLVREYDVASNLIRRRAFGHPPGRLGSPNVLLSDSRYLYDELDRVFQMDEALFVSDGFVPARPAGLRDQNSDGLVTTRLEYDALSRPTFMIEDDLQITRTIYDGADRPVERVDHLGNRLVTAYDRNSNPTRVQSIELSPESLVPNETFTTHYVYDQLDRAVRVTDNAGQTVRFAYDSRDNLVFRSDPQGAPIPDPLGLFPGQINEPGNTVAWFYDGLDRRILQLADLRVDGQGGKPLDVSNAFNLDGQVALGYAYDGNSRLIGILDDNGNRTRFSYDALDRRVRQINADNEAFVTVYDRDDNVRQVTDPNGTVLQNTFDALNRLTRVSVARASDVGGTTEVTYEYDGLSRQTRSVDNNGATANAQVCEYVYDSLSRVLEDRQNGQPVSTVWSGDSKRLRCTYPGGRVIDLTYDAIDRVKTVADQVAQISESAWIGPRLRELRRNYANNTRLSFLNDTGNGDIGYDAVQRITRLRHLRPGGQPFADREYGYNRANMRTFERRHEHAGLTDRYTYDSAYRVVRTELDQPAAAPAEIGARTPSSAAARSADWPSAVSPAANLPGAGSSGNAEPFGASADWQSALQQAGKPALHRAAPHAMPSRDLRALAYTYDGVGNRRQLARTTAAGTSTDTFTVNSMNEYDAITGVTRVHDDNGNLTDDGTRLLTYDYKNRLIAVRDKASGGLIAEYFYLADSRRTRKVVQGATPKTTDFLYDGWQVVEERDGPSGQTEVSYVYGQTYIDEPLQMQRTANHPLGAGTFFYHQNARYDVIAVTDNTGTVAEEVLYDDFGNPTIVGASPSPLSKAESAEGDSTADNSRPAESAQKKTLK
ncbi:MAG: DUF6531 domain-containing protein [Verrucomicrobiales bacterium]|nr:DUF6531 domain-containing protein [Verrucomicrobiales bacterium]